MQRFENSPVSKTLEAKTSKLLLIFYQLVWIYKIWVGFFFQMFANTIFKFVTNMISRMIPQTDNCQWEYLALPSTHLQKTVSRVLNLIKTNTNLREIQAIIPSLIKAMLLPCTLIGVILNVIVTLTIHGIRIGSWLLYTFDQFTFICRECCWRNYDVHIPYT